MNKNTPYPTLAEIHNIETRLQQQFPAAFKKYIQEHTDFVAAPFAEGDVTFVHSVQEIKAFSRLSSYHIRKLLLFFVDRTYNHYYCFQPDNTVAVFHGHAIVQTWDSFEDWLKWWYSSSLNNVS